MEMVATQMAALTYQSQLTATMAANSSQQMGGTSNTGPSTRSTPSKPASNDGADGGSFVQSERRRTRHRTTRTWSASTDGPICPKRIRTQQLQWPWRTGPQWPWRTGTRTWARSWPRPTCIYCGTCTPHHASHGREGTNFVCILLAHYAP